MRPPVRARLRARPVPLQPTTTHLPGGGVALDLGPALAQLDWRELLHELQLRGRV